MAKIKFGVKENNKVGTHSCYAVPQPNGTLTFDEVVEEACRNTSIEPSFLKAAVTEYMKAVQANVLKGFRVPVGKDFLTVYPNLTASVKDYTDEKTGELVVATPDMVTARNAKSRLGCTVSAKYSDEFEKNVSWQKVDQNGAVVEDEDINDQNPANDPTNQQGGQTDPGANEGD